MSNSWVEKDPVVIRNLNRACRWDNKGLPGQGKTGGRWLTIDGRWRGAELLRRHLEGEDGYQLQRRLDEDGQGLVLCRQYLPTNDGRQDWKYYTTPLPELIAEHAIEPAKREEAQRQLDEARG